MLCHEAKIDSDTFKLCEFLKSNNTIINNNADNDYGTAVIIKNNIQIQDVAFDTEGRVIIFNTGKLTIINIYPKAGTDA